jgi:hypothetical protein
VLTRVLKQQSTAKIGRWQLFLNEMNAAFGLVQKTFFRTFNIQEHRSYQQDEVIAAFRGNSKNLDLIKSALKLFSRDKEFVLKLIRINPEVFTLLDKSLKNDNDFVLEAIKANPDTAKLISSKLRQNSAFMEKVMMVLVHVCDQERLEVLMGDLGLNCSQCRFVYAYLKSDEYIGQLSDLAKRFSEEVVLSHSYTIISQASTGHTEVQPTLLEQHVEDRVEPVSSCGQNAPERVDLSHKAFQEALAQRVLLKQSSWGSTVKVLDEQLAEKWEARLRKELRSEQIERERLGLSKDSSEPVFQAALKAHRAECEQYGIDSTSTKQQLEKAKKRQKEQKIEAQLEMIRAIVALRERVSSLKKQLEKHELPSLRKQFETLKAQEKALIKQVKQDPVIAIDDLKALSKERFQLEEALREEIIESHPGIFALEDLEPVDITTGTLQPVTQEDSADLQTSVSKMASDLSEQISEQTQKLTQRATTIASSALEKGVLLAQEWGIF